MHVPSPGRLDSAFISAQGSTSLCMFWVPQATVCEADHLKGFRKASPVKDVASVRSPSSMRTQAFNELQVEFLTSPDSEEGLGSSIRGKVSIPSNSFALLRPLS